MVIFSYHDDVAVVYYTIVDQKEKIPGIFDLIIKNGSKTVMPNNLSSLLYVREENLMRIVEEIVSNGFWIEEKGFTQSFPSSHDLLVVNLVGLFKSNIRKVWNGNESWTGFILMEITILLLEL